MYVPIPIPLSPFPCIFVQQYFKLRSQAIQAQKQSGPHPYPHKFHVTMALTDFIEKYDDKLEPGDQVAEDIVQVAGEVKDSCPVVACGMRTSL